MIIRTNETEDIIKRLFDDLYSYLKSHPKIVITIEKDNEYYAEGIHCSSLGGCVRKAVYSYFNFPANEFNMQTELVFARGNFYHELVYLWLKASSQFDIIHNEFKVSEGLPEGVVGKFDVCFKDNVTGKKILADIKTANSNQFKKFSNYLPKEEHIIQLTSYAKGYEAMGQSFDLGLMMYFSTGADLPQFYFVEPYRNIDELIQGYVHAVENYKTAEILPPKLDELFDKKSIWQCSYCNYKDITCR